METFLTHNATKSSHNQIDPFLISSFTQAECQPQENEKSEKESQENINHPLGATGGERWGRCHMQTGGDKPDLSVSNLDLIR